MDESCQVKDWYECPFFFKGVNPKSSWINKDKEDTQKSSNVEYQPPLMLDIQDYGTTEETYRV